LKGEGESQWRWRVDEGCGEISKESGDFQTQPKGENDFENQREDKREKV
jgi:hypothetical protein